MSSLGSPIKSISIQGLTSFRDLPELELGRRNILIGANGAGKSNFIEAFRLLNHLIQGGLQPYVTARGRASRFLHLGPKVTKRITIDVDFGQNAYHVALEPTDLEQLMFAEEWLFWEPAPNQPQKKWSLHSGHLETGIKNDLEHNSKPSLSNYVDASLRDWIVYHFHDTSDTAAVKRAGPSNDTHRLRPDAANLAAYLLRLRSRPSLYSAVRDAVRQIAPYFDDFLLQPQPSSQGDVIALEWTQRGSDMPFRASQLSDGTLRFICLATALHQWDPPKTIIIDEPELGLHPAALAVFAALVREASTQTQIIASTQSVPLLDEFQPEDILVIDREDGQSVIRRLDEGSLKQWLDEYSLSDLWTKNVIGGRPRA